MRDECGGAVRVELAEHVVEQEQGFGADHVGDHTVAGEPQPEREGALLALRRVMTRVHAVEHERPVVAVRTDERDAAVLLATRERVRARRVIAASTAPRSNALRAPVGLVRRAEPGRVAGERRVRVAYRGRESIDELEARVDNAAPAATSRASNTSRVVRSSVLRMPARSNALRCFTTRS